MATIVEPAAVRPTRTIARHSERRPRTRFYLALALVCAAIAILGFAPSYWLQLPAGTFKGAPLLHIHGALATAWVLFLISQSTLVTRGSVARHRDWGLFGISLASVLTVVAIMVAIQSMTAKLAQGAGDPVRSFLIVPLSGILMFAGFTAAAVANIRRPEWHRRFMIVGTVGLARRGDGARVLLLRRGRRPRRAPGLMPAPPPAAMPLLSGLLLRADPRRRHDPRQAHARPHPPRVDLRLRHHDRGDCAPRAVRRDALWLATADWLGRIAG